MKTTPRGMWLMISCLGLLALTGCDFAKPQLLAPTPDLGTPIVIQQTVQGGQETGLSVNRVAGLRTREDRQSQARSAQPGDREFVVGVLNLCEGGMAISSTVTFLPAIVSARHALAGGLKTTPCISRKQTQQEETDGFPTVLTQMRIAFSGPGAAGVTLVRVYLDTSPDDLASNAIFFEPQELIQAAVVNEGEVVLGVFDQSLRNVAGQALVFPDGGDAPEPHLFYFTVDLAQNTIPGPITMSVSLLVGGVQGMDSSQLSDPSPQTFTIEVGGADDNAVPGPSIGLKGDVNQDGKIDQMDVVVLSKATRGRILLSAFSREAAQVALPCSALNREDVRYLIRMVNMGVSSQCP